MRVNKSKARTAAEEADHWRHWLHTQIDEKLPWDMHPNEIRADKMRKDKARRKMLEALDSEEYEA